MPFMEVPSAKWSPPAKLQGPIKTRAEARRVYSEIVEELHACGDREQLELYLMTIGEELLQFENELDRYWKGDGDEPFLGLEAEIKRAFGRFATFY